MQANYVQRLRVTFSKLGPTRFISHLDVARTWERALNRAKIPMAYTQGFNKRPRMQFATATPLGFTSECELMEIWLQEALNPETAKTSMMSRMAPGIEVLHVSEVPLSASALQTRTLETTYVATLKEDVPPFDELQMRVNGLMNAPSLMRERFVKKKRRTYDLRPLILELQLAQTAAEALELMIRLRLEPARTGRPDEVLRALEIDPLGVPIHRTHILLKDDDSSA